MDEFEKRHMQTWLDNLYGDDYWKERNDLKKDLIKLTDEYPELLKTHSWPEMHRLVLRRKKE